MDAETLLGKAKTPDAKIATKKVYEALRYSDPMSSEALGEIEAELAEKFRALEAAVTADQRRDRGSGEPAGNPGGAE